MGHTARVIPIKIDLRRAGRRRCCRYFANLGSAGALLGISKTYSFPQRAWRSLQRPSIPLQGSTARLAAIAFLRAQTTACRKAYLFEVQGQAASKQSREI